MDAERIFWGALAFLGAWLYSGALLGGVSYALAERGRLRAAFVLARWVRRLTGIGRSNELAFLSYLGRTEEAIACFERLRWARISGHLRSVAVNVLISAGRYAQALGLDAGVTRDPLRDLNAVNFAEAEYNLGRWDDALLRMDQLELRAAEVDHLALAGARLQRAWILAHQGRASEARAAFGSANAAAIPMMFASEVHYTAAAVELSAGDLRAALAAAEHGLKIVRRVSSHRNGLFLRARIHVAAGNTAAALADFEAAAAFEYKGQGGDGLLAWGNLLRDLGRIDEAKAAWQLAVERDQESESAAIARAQLGR